MGQIGSFEVVQDGLPQIAGIVVPRHMGQTMVPENDVAGLARTLQGRLGLEEGLDLRVAIGTAGFVLGFVGVVKPAMARGPDPKPAAVRYDGIQVSHYAQMESVFVHVQGIGYGRLSLHRQGGVDAADPLRDAQLRTQQLLRHGHDIGIPGNQVHHPWLASDMPQVPPIAPAEVLFVPQMVLFAKGAHPGRGIISLQLRRRLGPKNLLRLGHEFRSQDAAFDQEAVFLEEANVVFRQPDIHASRTSCQCIGEGKENPQPQSGRIIMHYERTRLIIAQIARSCRRRARGIPKGRKRPARGTVNQRTA